MKIDLKLDKKYINDKQEITKTLEKPSQKMNEVLNQLFKQESITGYKPHPTAFFAQMIVHKSHHRGQIMTIVTRNGFKIDKSVNFGLWNWDK